MVRTGEGLWTHLIKYVNFSPAKLSDLFFRESLSNLKYRSHELQIHINY